MAITRTEIAKQLLAYGGRIGLKKGDMPDRQQYSATQTQTGVVKGGGKSLGGGKFEDAVVTGDDLRTAGNKINQNFTELYLKDSDGIIDKAELQAAMNASDSFGSFKSAILAL